MFVLHLLFAIFAIGPLVHAVTTAGRGIRQGDAAATASAARMTQIYSYASILVIVFGFGLMSAKSPYSGEAVASFGETWIWLSALLWLVAAALALGIIVPGLKKATALIGGGDNAKAIGPRVAACGGVVALIFIVIVVLMVYQPGA